MLFLDRSSGISSDSYKAPADCRGTDVNSIHYQIRIQCAFHLASPLSFVEANKRHLYVLFLRPQFPLHLEQKKNTVLGFNMMAWKTVANLTLTTKAISLETC